MEQFSRKGNSNNSITNPSPNRVKLLTSQATLTNKIKSAKLQKETASLANMNNLIKSSLQNNYDLSSKKLYLNRKFEIWSKYERRMDGIRHPPKSYRKKL